MLLPAPFILQRRGASTSDLPANGGEQTIVASGANVNGLLIRTLYILSGASSVEIRIGGLGCFFCANNGFFNYVGPPFFVAPGLALTFWSNAAAGNSRISWDVL